MSAPGIPAGARGVQSAMGARTTIAGLFGALVAFDRSNFDSDRIRQHAETFDRRHFAENLQPLLSARTESSDPIDGSIVSVVIPVAGVVVPARATPGAESPDTAVIARNLRAHLDYLASEELAGRDSGWYFLANNTERTSWPVFCEHYQRYCARVLQGETFTLPPREQLEHHEAQPLSREDQLAELKKLREGTGL